MKHTKKLLSAILSATTLLSTLAPITVNAIDNSYESLDDNQSIKTNQIFSMYEDEKGIHFIGPTGNDVISDEDVSVSEEMSDTYLSNNKEQGKVLSNGAANGQASESLPASIDNSQSEFFPEIGNQGSLGSCTFWAQIYYQFTYTMNKEMNCTTTPENTFSPQWAYNIVAGTNEMIGPYYSAYEFMRRQGNVFLSQVPYDLDVSSFSPTEDIWKTSIRYRLKGYENLKDIGLEDSQITSVNDTDLTEIKTALNNGDVLAFSTHINSWNTIKIKKADSLTENNKYVGEYTVKSQTGTKGGHRMTIVGYNDNIWTDVNDNNVVDSGEMGALKIANSWGSGYGNNGFVWVAYDAINKTSCVAEVEEDSTREEIFREVSRIEVLPYNTDANLYLKYTLNTSDRTQVLVSVTAEKDGTEYTAQAISNEYSGDKCAYDGTTNASDATMIFLLSNVVEGITSETFDEYNWSVTFNDTSQDGNIFTVKNAEIVDESTNMFYKPANAYPLTLDGNEKTLEFSYTSLNNAVIYYRGYDNPVINYQNADGTWISTNGIAMEENIERRGYVYKYVIELGNRNEVMLYFVGENGNVDNNNGKYYTANKGLNYYVTENVAEPIVAEITNKFNDITDVDYCSMFEANASGGYAPYQYQFICENLETGEVSTTEYSDRPSYTSYFRKEGQYRVSVNVMDHSDEVVQATSIITVKEIPFEISELSIAPNTHIMVGDELQLNAVTNYEHIMPGSSNYTEYNITIERDGEKCYTATVKPTTTNISFMTSTIVSSWTPSEAGNYSLTISATERKNQYAEKTVNFSVYEYNGTIMGDANNDKKISVADAMLILKYNIKLVEEKDVWMVLADCDKNDKVDIKDAICVLRRVVGSGNCASAGEVNYREPVTEPPTEVSTTTPTEAPTEAPTVAEENIVTFTNSLNWSGTIYCYYWSDSNTTMISWPGKAMTKAGTNTYGQTLYTFNVPDDATYVIFTNGSVQTVDIPYSGGEIKYYPTTTDSKGHYNVETW